MKKFSEFVSGESFYATCSISNIELEAYLKFSKIKNILLENKIKEKHQMVSGRAMLSRMEGGVYKIKSNLWKSHYFSWDRWRFRMGK